jgi:acyl dehydratase
VSPPPAIPAALLGRALEPVTRTLDARWLMAYAAGLGETDPRYFDTEAADGPSAHPLFAVCYEWPLMEALRDTALDPAAAARSVHAGHRVAIHRPPRAGDRLTTTARVTALERIRPGTLLRVRFATVDAAGAPVTTTDYDTIFRGCDLHGADGTPAAPHDGGRAAADRPAAPAPRARWEEVVEVPPTAAHVYTECARIWNPIHTDRAVARRVGLPGPILHGTATLALAVSRVVARELAGDPARVREVRGRFSGMVPLGSRFTVRGWAGAGASVGFDALGPDGRPVVSEGALRAGAVGPEAARA